MSDFLVPDLGEGLEDATITGWSVAVGDDVELNQTLCMVETNKAEVEIPSPYAGRIVELGGAEGETLAVGAVLVRIATDAPAPASQNGGKPARKAVLVGYGTDDDMDTSRRVPVQDGTRPRAKPPVRKLAADMHVDLASLTPGSGPDGIVTREDVLAAAGSATDSDTVDVNGVQATMAQRMTLSRSKIPDAHASVQVDCSALLRVRDRLREAVGEDGPPITPFVLTLRLLTIALTASPDVQLDLGGHRRRTAHPRPFRGAPGVRGGGTARAAGAGRQGRAGQVDARVGGDGVAAHRGSAGRNRQTDRAAGLHVHGVELRRARAGRGSARHQLSRGRHPGHGVVETAAGRRRRCRRGATDDDADVRLRPPHCRRCAGRRVPGRAAAI